MTEVCVCVFLQKYLFGVHVELFPSHCHMPAFLEGFAARGPKAMYEKKNISPSRQTTLKKKATHIVAFEQIFLDFLDT